MALLQLDDYADLGYGYDSNDSFIDNGDVHDEIVPENVTTAYGGFYVNSGPLEFKVCNGRIRWVEMSPYL